MGYLGLVVVATVMTALAVATTVALTAVVLAVRAGARTIGVAKLVVGVGAGQRVAISAEVEREVGRAVGMQHTLNFVVAHLGPRTGVLGAIGFGVGAAEVIFYRQAGNHFVSSVVVGPAPIVNKREGCIFFAGGQSHGQRDEHRQD